jgi:hypothetical protein
MCAHFFCELPFTTLYRLNNISRQKFLCSMSFLILFSSYDGIYSKEADVEVNVLSSALVTKTRVWIGESVYWIFTSHNYK